LLKRKGERELEEKEYYIYIIGRFLIMVMVGGFF
jgi:hypothetical protein